MQVLFSEDYFTARQRFREHAARGDWQLETHPLAEDAPDRPQPPGGPANDNTLCLDVAISGDCDAEQVLVVSSGLHGVEGFYGSAVQLAVLQQWAELDSSGVKCILMHALNPYGFAKLRRFDEHNVDLNRNFLPAGQPYTGHPAGYADLDSLLNPQRGPSRLEPFHAKAIYHVLRHGMPKLRQAIAAGQYDYPNGLFYGGSKPAAVHTLLEANLPRWIGNARQVVHLDLHTGLGKHATGKLLLDYAITPESRQRLRDWFGDNSFETSDRPDIAYASRGGLGAWCVHHKLAEDYLFATAEFGTYGPIQVLAGLRAENQAHLWGQPDSPATLRAKRKLKELFCPASPRWRQTVLQESLTLVSRALHGLRSTQAG